MKTAKVLTIGELKQWCERKGIPDNTPIGIYCGETESGHLAYGVVGETEDEIDIETSGPINVTEITGEHCYLANNSIQAMLKDAETERIIMITDGNHEETEDREYKSKEYSIRMDVTLDREMAYESAERVIMDALKKAGIVAHHRGM